VSLTFIDWDPKVWTSSKIGRSSCPQKVHTGPVQRGVCLGIKISGLCCHRNGFIKTVLPHVLLATLFLSLSVTGTYQICNLIILVNFACATNLAL